MVLMSGLSRSQQSNLTLEHLRTPSMPSATIIGAQMEDVSRPASLRELEASVFTSVYDPAQGLRFPENYAVEFNPFMLGPRENFDYREYLKNEADLNAWRNLCISVATTTGIPVTDSISVHGLGIGARTVIFNGTPPKDVETAYMEAVEQNSALLLLRSSVSTLLSSFEANDSSTIEDIQEFVAEELGKMKEFENAPRYIALFRKVFASIKRDTTFERLEESFLDLFTEKTEGVALAELREKLSQVKLDRFGFRWEVDAALALSFPDGDFNDCIAPRHAVWTNISYKSEDLDAVQFIALARLIWNNSDFYRRYQRTDESYCPGIFFDLGVSLNYEYKRLSMKAEFVFRRIAEEEMLVFDGREWFSSTTSSTSKYLLNLNYNATDDINISYSLGKDYENGLTGRANLLTGLSINLGFGAIQASHLLPEGE